MEVAVGGVLSEFLHPACLVSDWLGRARGPAYIQPCYISGLAGLGVSAGNAGQLRAGTWTSGPEEVVLLRSTLLGVAGRNFYYAVRVLAVT